MADVGSLPHLDVFSDYPSFWPSSQERREGVRGEAFRIGGEGGGGHCSRFSSSSSFKVVTKSHRNRNGNLDHVRLHHDIKARWKLRRSLASSVERLLRTRVGQLMERGRSV